MGQIRCRFARRDPPLDCIAERGSFGRQYASVKPWVKLVNWEMQRMKDKECRFVETRRGAVPVDQLGFIEPADGIAQPVAYRDKIIFRFRPSDRDICHDRGPCFGRSYYGWGPDQLAKSGGIGEYPGRLLIGAH